MWRCATADDSSDNSYLDSLNKFAGRQQWVFDPKGGSATARQEVEQQRARFASNRHQQKHAADELYRSACCSARNSRSLPRVPGAALGTTADVIDGDVHDALIAGSAYFAALQVAYEITHSLLSLS